MELPVEGPFSQITALLSSNVSEGFEAMQPSQQSWNSHPTMNSHKRPCRLTGFKCSSLRTVGRRRSDDEYTKQAAKRLEMLMRDAGMQQVSYAHLRLFLVAKNMLIFGK